MEQRSLSFIVPFHNEHNTIELLSEKIADVCTREGYTYELIFVDDGSVDGGFETVRALAKNNHSIRGLRFQRNFGQTAALHAGIRASHFPLIVTLDADMQNDPADVPLLLRKIDQGFDVVSGTRAERRDTWRKRFASFWANKCISYITGVHLTDYGCALKIYRREYVEHAPLYGEMHRFVPILAAWYGARVTEVPVRHHPRIHGRSHYDVAGRTIRVVLDLLTVKFLHSYISRPMHFFGGAALVFLLCGVVSGITTIFLKLLHLKDFVATPLPLLTVFLVIIGVLCLLMGLLAELLIRVYFDQPSNSPYRIYEKVGFSGTQT